MAATARTEGERRVLEGAPTGQLVDLGGLADEERVISADVIRRLCIGQESVGVDPRGLRINRARIVDVLDLSFSVVSFPVRFEETTFIVAPDLTSAHLPALWLTRCSLPGIVCEGMRLDGDLILDSSEIDRETVLRGARIGGVLWCVGAKMSNEEGDAITADSAEIDGGVFLRGPFSVVGAVRFPRAKIRGDFDCQGAILTHKNDDALVLDGAEISGPLIVQKAHATGAVRLPSARIGGNVYFHDATLSNEGPSDESVSGFADRAAIYADNAEVNGNFYLGYGLRASGAVQLVGTKIAGDLFCRLVTLSNESGYALSAERAEIDGTLDFYGSSATGEVRLTGAEIGGDLNCSSTRLVNNRYAEVPEIEEFALRAREVAIGGSLIFDDVREVIGGVDLYRSSSAALVDDVGSDDDPLGSWDGVRPLILDGFTYGRFGERTEWSSKLRARWLRATTGFQHAAWQQLIQVYRSQGLDDEAARAAIAMQNDRLTRAGLSWYRRAGRYVLRAVVGHGYRPWLAGAWAVAIIAIFALLVWQFPGMFVSNPGVRGSPQSVAYAADTFMPIVDLGQKDDWQPIGWMRWLDWTVILLGWALTTIFVAGFTRIVRSE